MAGLPRPCRRFGEAPEGRSLGLLPRRPVKPARAWSVPLKRHTEIRGAWGNHVMQR